jgi:hypothetical protein
MAIWVGLEHANQLLKAAEVCPRFQRRQHCLRQETVIAAVDKRSQKGWGLVRLLGPMTGQEVGQILQEKVPRSKK